MTETKDTQCEFNFAEAVSEFGGLLKRCKEMDRETTDMDSLLMQMADLTRRVVECTSEEDAGDFLAMIHSVVGNVLTSANVVRFYQFLIENSLGGGVEANSSGRAAAQSTMAEVRGRVAVCTDCQFNPQLYPKMGDKAVEFCEFLRDNFIHRHMDSEVAYSVIALAKNYGLGVKVERDVLQKEAEFVRTDILKPNWALTFNDGFYTKTLRQIMTGALEVAYYQQLPFQLYVTTDSRHRLFIELVYKGGDAIPAQEG